MSVRRVLLIAFAGSGGTQSINIQWNAGSPSIALPHLEDGERMTRRMAPKEVDDRYEEVYSGSDFDREHETIEISSTGQPHQNTPSDDATAELPRGSMRAALKRLGARLPAADDDEQALKAALTAALHKARMPLLRGLLFERGGQCVGCSERPEFVQAVLASLRLPLVGRHALWVPRGIPNRASLLQPPHFLAAATAALKILTVARSNSISRRALFLYDQPLFPHSQTGLTLYEPRYKLLCRKALKLDRYFGFVSGSSGERLKIL